MAERSYEGDPLDQSWQYFGERPYDDADEQADDDQDDEEVVYVTDPEPQGEATTTNVPIPGREPERPDVDGQSTFVDWGAVDDEDGDTA